MQTLSQNDRIVKARAAIMRDKRFLAIAGIMMVGKWQLSDSVKTAATNGRDVYYNPEFVSKLNDKELRFLILHEYYHVLLMQLHVWKHLWKQDAILANMAADYVVNLMLDKLAGDKADGFIQFIKNGCLNYDYDGLDTGEVFRRLKQQQQQQQQGKKGQQGEQGDGEPLDDHDTDGAELPGLSDQEMEQLKQQIDTSVRQAAQVAGKLGANLDRSITDLLEVTVPWPEQLRDFVSTTAVGDDLSTWRRPSRRWMARDIYMPSRYSESVERITVGVDTSGSIDETQLRKALTEIKGICEAINPQLIDIIYWDSEVASHETYDQSSLDVLVNSTKPKGGGGTRVRSMLDYMLSHSIKPNCVVVFTDGYVERDWGGSQWPAPVMWCVSTKGITAPFGKTLYVPAT